MAKRRKKGRRKTYRLKRTAKKAAGRRGVYKVKGGWRVSRTRARRGRRKKRRRKR